MRHRLYVHLIWTTRDRAPLITASVAGFLVRFLPAVADQERATLICLGMVTTHVHLLLRLEPVVDIARLVQRLKGASAALATREGHAATGHELRWAKGYNLESVSPSDVPAVLRYLQRQPERHPDEAIPDWATPAP